MNKRLVTCIRKRDDMHSRAKKFSNNKLIWDRYKKYRNYCHLLLQSCKNQHESELIRSSVGNSKKLWRNIKNICNIKKSIANTNDLLTLKSDRTEALNNINNFFSSIGNDLAYSILQKLDKLESEIASSTLLDATPIQSLFFIPTDDIEIIKIISTLKTSSATGHDGISNNFLKKAKYVLASPIAHICNLSMLSGLVPDCFKMADICPIYKSGNTFSISNYRPISLLPSLSKILEKVVNKRLLGFLEQHHLLSQNQFGFRANRSTEDAVVALVDCVTRKLDSGQKCLGVFLDLAKAFDTVSWPILLRKLELYGIRGVTLDWFRSYLYERKQRVRVSVDHSDYANVSFGVPQGSVLGPTLFLVYINDLCQLNIEQANIFTFADDTALVFHGKNWEEVVDVAQKGMSRVANWLQNNLLTLNTTKTKYIAFRITQHSKPNDNMNLKLHSCSSPHNQLCICPELQIVDRLKYLGVVIDQQLNWEAQISTLCGRLRKMIHVFKKLGRVADPESIKIIYLALCQSILNYCIVCWGSASKTSFLKIERAQRAVLKVAYRKPYRYETESLYRDTKYLRVRQLYILAVTLRFHKTAINAASQSKRSARRNIWKTPHTKTTFAQRAFSFKGAYVYQYLDRKLDILQLSRYVCRNKVSTWLMALGYEETEKVVKIDR